MKKVKKLLFVLFVTLIVLPLTLKASDSMTLNVDKTDLTVGDEITVSASMPSDTKSYALLATLKYDENVFERIDDSDFEIDEEKMSISYNKNNKKFGIINKSENMPPVLFSVHLKVKDNASVGNTTIALTNISTSDGKNSENYDKTTTVVSVTRDALDGEVIPLDKENNVTVDEENIITTFTTRPILIILLVIMLISTLGGIIIYTKKEDKRPSYALFTISALILITVFGLFVFNNNKKDVNDDGNKDYDDAEAIIDYLIDIENEQKEENKEENNNTSTNTATGVGFASGNFDHDINNDGVVDVSDAAGIIPEVNKSTKVDLETKEELAYLSKGEELTLEFNAEINKKGVTIKQVKINNEYYNVTLDNGVYYVKLNASEISGSYTFEITEVVLSNDEKIKTKLKITKEILKDEPYVNKFNLNDELGTLSFELVDTDAAFINGTVTLYEEEVAVAKENIEKGKTTISFEPNLDKNYEVYIEGNYDLDSKTNDNKNNYNNKTMYSDSFMLGGDYEFNLRDISITDAVEEGSTPVLSFTSTNNRNASVTLANITTKETTKDYNITKQDGDKYEVALTGVDTTPGKHTVKLNNVGLSSLKTFYKNEDFEDVILTYTVLKKAPTIENLTLTDNHDRKEIKAKFNLNDLNESTNKLTIILEDSNNKTISTKEISKENIKDGIIETTLSYENNLDGYYIVKVLADYDLSDNYKYTNKILGEKDILTTTESDIYIKSMTISNNNLYPTKKQNNYTVSFEVYVGESIRNIAKKYGDKKAYNKISSVTINGLNYPASSSSADNINFKVNVTLTVPDNSGVLEIKASRLQLGMTGYYNMTNSDYYSVEEKKVTIDILKDIPKIENLIIKDDFENDEATFNFDIILDKNALGTENDFNNGYVKLGSDKQTITNGHNEITFKNIEKNTNLDLTFYGSYDLDTDSLTETTDKNEYKDKVLFETKYGLYNKEIYDSIKIENASEISVNGNKYFEKNEKIKLNFDITGINEDLSLTAEKVIINDKEYILTKNKDNYELILDGYHSSGIKELTLTEVILNNGKKVTLKTPYTFTPEVLKTSLTVEDYSYELLEGKIKVNFNLKDSDKSLVGKAKVLITDEEDNIIYNDIFGSSITFNQNGSIRYKVKVLANFDRDIDKTVGSDNYNSEAILLSEVISLDKNYIELKDIVDINLYKYEGDEVVLKDTVSGEDIKNNKDKYFVEIDMDSLPTIRASISNVVENDTLTLVLEYDYVTLENTNRTQTIRIDYGTIKNGEATNEYHPKNAFKKLLEELESGKDVTLNRNYDASALEVETETYITSTYTGNLNGNGYSIRNLSKPLFNKLDSGLVENLRLEEIKLSQDSEHGALANEASQETIKNVYITSFIHSNTPTGSGTLVGSITNTTVESCRAISFDMKFDYFDQQIGGLIGSASSSKVINNYVNGSISGGWNYRGGLVGNASLSTIENNYTKVALGAGYGNNVTAGIIDSTTNNNIVKNNVNLSAGFNHAISKDSKKENNYYLYGSVSTNEDIKITESEVNSELFKTRAKFDETIWNLKDISIDSLPTLVEETKTKLQSIKGYEESKELLYRNLMKLTPFYDNEKIVETASNINDELLLNKEITHIVPVEADGNLVTYLTTDNPKKISKLKIIFKNGEKTEYNLTYEKTYDMVATYKIDELGIDYNYNHYVINSASQVVNNLTNYLQGLDYTNNLDILTTNSDSRIYRDFYNETTKNELKEFVLKYLSNSEYTNTTNIDIINSYIEREVKKDKKIEKALYAYNYFRRFYDLDIDGLKMYDFILYNMQGFDSSLTPDKIIDLYFSDSKGAYFSTGVTSTAYYNLLSKYTGYSYIPDFLEYLVPHLSNYNIHDWSVKQYKGILVELPIEGEEDIRYTLWDHFTNDDQSARGTSYKVYNFVLPILTLPETTSYIISSPVQFLIGSQRRYMVDPTNEAELEKFKTKMNAYTDRMKSYYTTAYSILQDKSLFNNINIFQIDKRYTYNEDGTQIFNNPYVTEELFHKNFNEVVGIWPAEAGNNAAAWGDYMEWQAAGIMDSELTTDGTPDTSHVSYKTWSHETAHIIDSRLFFKNNSRRFDGHGEDYSDYFLRQSFDKSEFTMNLSQEFTKGSTLVASNLTPERISSKDKVKDFYSKVFDTLYIMDYLEAQAFLKLTPEEKAVIAQIIDYPNEGVNIADDNFYTARNNTRFTEQTVEFWKNLELNTIYDLFENKVAMEPGIYKVGSRGVSSYGGQGIGTVHWCQPNNPDGRPDSYSLKWFSYEMLGYAGYDDGFVEYASSINSERGTVEYKNYKTDNMIINRISNGKYNTIDEYKLDRLKETEKNIEHVRIINIEDYAQKFYDALIQDYEYMPKRIADLTRNGEEACLNYYY